MPVTHRRKPVEVEAYRFREDGKNFPEIAAWCGGRIRFALAVPTDPDTRRPYVDIATREGTMTASPGDWIIREPNPTDDRRFYPVKPEIFAAGYDEITDTEERA